jgi:hypothetical protein
MYLISKVRMQDSGIDRQHIESYWSQDYFITILCPWRSRVLIYPNLIVICVPSLADNFYTPWRYITHSSADLHTVTSSH